MKKRGSRLLTFAISVMLLLFGSSLFVNAEEPQNPIANVQIHADLSARAAILIEEKSGTVLYEKAADTRLPMASTTKIMTALVALENCPADQVISVPKEAVGTEGSSIYLFEDEQLTLEELVWALLLSSANDAAVAIACGVAGSVEAFADLMNQKAVDLGLTNTHFVNPHGLDDVEHYTTARDLSQIARATLANPIIRTMVATRKKTIPHNGTDGVRLLVNHNKLLRMYNGAIGVKTGFTKRSGRCLVSAAERDELCLIAVTLDAPSDWSDHCTLLDAGFAALSSLALGKKGDFLFSVPVVGGNTHTVTISNPEPINAILPSEHGTVTATVELPHFLYAPIDEGCRVGQIVWYADGKQIAQAPLLAQEAIKKAKKQTWFQKLWDQIFLKKEVRQ